MRRVAMLFAALLALPLVVAAQAGASPVAAAAKIPAGVPGDFNGDGFADLAVGAANEGIGTAQKAGAVNVLYGSATGLTSANNQLWDENNDATGDPAQTGDLFGAAVATGDFNGDGFSDLAVGVPLDDLTATSPSGREVSRTDAGAVTVLYGTSAGLQVTAPIAQRWKQDSVDILGISEAGDQFGTSLATGDLNGDGKSDLVVGVPGETIGTATGTGAVNVIYGSDTGLTAAGNQFFHQGGNGLLGTDSSNDAFGFSVAAGHFGGADPTVEDLAVGAPVDAEAGPGASGAVNVIYGTPGTGLTTTGNQLWTQNSPNILGVAEANDLFGFDVAVGEFDDDTASELAIGAPGETIGGKQSAGFVNVIHGDPAAGLTSAGNQFFNEGSNGLGGTADAGDGFGNSMWAGNMGLGAQGDLAIAAAGDQVASASGAGTVTVVYGSDTGLTTTGDQVWSQDSTGILGVAESGDAFGFDVYIGNFGGPPENDLAVGVGLEDLCGGADVVATPGAVCRADTGAVNVIYGSAGGLSPDGNQQWTQDSPNIKGVAETGDTFGYDVA